MGLLVSDGSWSYLASTGASTHVIQTGQRLLALRAFANGSDGSIQIIPRTTSTGTTAAPITIRSGFGLDWTPAAQVSRAVIVASASIDLFAEFSS